MRLSFLVFPVLTVTVSLATFSTHQSLLQSFHSLEGLALAVLLVP